ncbi:hypothetical protein HV183_09965 [Citrobacter freundii]|uniref:DUF4411 family protein n=1 Tax=Citrobacter freundii TaxID=546 RepID=A0AAE7GSC5_CITFR|nr:hypothetical protein [Citrobacter freundii]QLO13727.1 hypothetical protein HV183_09965 [Citrobacter freundii]
MNKLLPKINIIFDNNVWDLLYKWDIKLHSSYFSEHFKIIYPKVVGVEHDHVNTPPEVKKYKDEQLKAMDYDSPAFFGFADQPASSGFGQGFMADESDMDFIGSGHKEIKRNVPFPQDFADKNILAFANRSDAYVVTMDDKKPYKSMPNVIFLKEIKNNEMTTQQFTMFLLSIINKKINDTSGFNI